MTDWWTFVEGIASAIVIETLVVIFVSERVRQGLFRLLSATGNYLRNPDVETLTTRVFDVESVPAEVIGARPSPYLREKVRASLEASNLGPAGQGGRTVEFDLTRRARHVRCIISAIDSDPDEPLGLKVSLRTGVSYRTVGRDLLSSLGEESRVVEALTAQLHLRPRGWGVHISFPQNVPPLSMVDPKVVRFVSGQTPDSEVTIRVGPRSIDAEGQTGESLERLLRTVIARAPRGAAAPSG
jgi:hypothetical protein